MNTASPPPYANEVYRRLLWSVPTATTGRRAWHAADPYVLRHAAEHAVDAGALDELLNDPEFLVYGDPEPVNALLSGARTDRGRLAAAVYRASFGVHRDLRPEQRRQILALDACRLGARELSRALTETSGWHVRWATGQQVSTTLLTTLAGHEDRITAVAGSLVGGRPVAVAGDDAGTIRVWDLVTGHTIATFGHSAGITSLVTSRIDGRAVALTGSFDGSVRLWDLATGTQERKLSPGRDTFATAIAATPAIGGRILGVCGNRDGTVRVWDLASGRAVAALPGHADEVTAVAVLPEPLTAVTSSIDGTVRVWDLTANAQVGQLRQGHYVTTVTAAMIDGLPVALTANDDRTVCVWNLTTKEPGTVIQSGHSELITAVAVTTIHDRSALITGSKDRTARVVDIADGYVIATLSGHTSSITTLADTVVDGRTMIVTGSADHTVRVWDATAGYDAIPQPSHEGRVTAIGATRLSGNLTAVTAGYDGKVRSWNMADGEAVASPLEAYSDRLSTMAVSTIGTRPVAITGGYDGAVRAWDLATGAPGPKMRFQHHGRVSAIAVATLDDRPVVVSGGYDGVLHIWDPATGVPIGAPLPPLGGRIAAVAAASMGRRVLILASSEDHTLALLDLSTRGVRQEFTDLRISATALALATIDHQVLAVVGSHDGTVQMWDPTSGETVGSTLPGHADRVCAVALAALEDTLITATCALDNAVNVSKMGGTPLATLQLPDTPRCVTIAPDGTIAVGMGHEVIAYTIDTIAGRS